MPNFSGVFTFGQGVSFFFVLSGFILTYVYVGSGNNFKIKKFLRARFARLYPVHIVTFLAAILLLPNVQDTMAQRVSQIPLQLTMTQSWLGTYKAAFGFNGPAWSISTEFGFYLIFPLLLKFYKSIYRIFFTSVVFTGLIIFGAAHLNGAIATWLWEVLHLHPLGRLMEFICGICAAKVFLNSRISLPKGVSTASEILIILLIIVVGSLNTEVSKLLGRLENGHQLTAYFFRSGMFVFFGLLIWIFAHAQGAVSRLLSYSIFVGLGKISFAFYMIHQIVIYFFEQNYELLLGYGSLTAFVFLFSLSLGFSYVAYRLIELPFQNVILKRKDIKAQTNLAKPKVLSVSVVATLTLVVGYFVPVFSPGYQEPSSQFVSRFQSQAIEANIRAVNADAVLMHYRYDRSEDQICYEMLWAFGGMEFDTPIKRIVNIPYEEGRRSISHQMLLPPSAWVKSDTEKKYVLDEFCFATLPIAPRTSGRLVVRLTLRQKTETGFAPLQFSDGERVQNTLFLDYRDPGPVIWLKKANPG